jgi:hypothetical protein
MGDLARLLELKAEGYRFLIYSADLALIMQALKQGIQALRSGAASAPAKAGIY